MGPYWVRAWAYPSHTKSKLIEDKTAPNGVKSIEVPAFTTFRTRRDGRVERSWVDIEEAKLCFEITEDGKSITP